MPFAIVKLVKGALSAEQKRLMVQRVTDAIVSVEGEALRQGVQVVIEESINDGEWSVGGNLLTIEAMQKIKSGQNPWE